MDPPLLPDRPRNANKVTAGRVLVVGGSRDMAGAPAMAGLGALRAGAGLVRLAVPRGIQALVAGYRCETTTAGLPETDAGALSNSAHAELLTLAGGWDAVVLGPGLGRDEQTLDLVRTFTPAMDRPALLDADALFAWNGRLEELASRHAPTVLTPHEGEAARLLGVTSEEVRADRQAAARRIADAAGAIVVLKGPHTLVAGDGRLYVNQTGGPALATGGTGDVLAGVIGAFLALDPNLDPAAGLDAFDAACLGVHVHGAAADAVAGERDRGLLATELASGVPHIIAALRSKRQTGAGL